MQNYTDEQDMVLILVLVRVDQRNGINRTHLSICKEIYHEGLTLTVVKAEKSHGLLSERRWRSAS